MTGSARLGAVRMLNEPLAVSRTMPDKWDRGWRVN